MEKTLGFLARWMVILALMVAYWPFGRVHAAQTPTFKNALYSANFNWKGYKTPLRFAVGTVEQKENGQSRFMALISQEGKPLATCERVIAGDAPYDANSMTLRCEGSLFNSKSALAKFSFASMTERPTLLIEADQQERKLVILNNVDGA